MGIITLTDRISVSVRAKNETESNNQKRATGKNIANALTSGGSADISDDLADQLGNTSKPTITDEQGREWVAMSDIIAAGKKMQQEGAFEEKKSFLTSFGDRIIFQSGDSFHLYDTNGKVQRYVEGSGGSFITAFHNASTSGWKIIIASFNTLSNGTYNLSGFSSSVNNTRKINDVSVHYNVYDTDYFSNYTSDISVNPISYASKPGDLAIAAHMLNAYDDVETSGGSIIDWTKPDDEIEEDIRNLHETWDVTEHAGSVNANGTYVLAGPIEFNPDD